MALPLTSKIARSGCVLIALVVLSGCFAQYADRRVENTRDAYFAYQAASPCCTRLEQLRHDSWSGKPLKVDLGSESSAFEFPTGKSFLASYQLPPDSSTRVLRVKGLMTGSSQITGTTMVPAAVSFLDASKRLIGSATVGPIAYHMGMMTDSRAGGIGFVEVPNLASFVVFHTDPRLFGKSFSFSKTGGGNYVNETYLPGSTYDFTVPFVPAGQLYIRFATSDEVERYSSLIARAN
jgi:hypothetical protein